MPLIPDQLRELAGRVPDEVAYVAIGQGSLTFGAWHTDSSRFARGLVSRGVAAGDRVALLCAPDDALRFVVAYHGIQKAGAVAVPVNIRLSPPELAGIFGHCEPAAVVVSDQLEPLLPPGLPTVLRVSELEKAFEGGDEDIQVPRDAEDLAEILYTSGTTGMPKGVAIRHSNSAMVVFTQPEWSGRVWLYASPMFTFAGLTFVNQPMRMGMRSVYLPRFDAAEWLRAVAEHQPMCVFLVPAMVELLLAHPDFATAGLSSIQLCSVGSAPVAPATLNRLQAALPHAAVSNSYSITEAGAAYCVLPKGELEKRPGSVGLPMPPTKVRILSESGAELPAGEVGEVVIQPPGRQREYYRNEDASAAMWHDGWLHTGDLGRLDDDGYLYIVGRIKDVIIRGGYNIYAVDVETVLYEHPAVREAAVVGVPHDVLGEDIAAYVVASAPVSADELVAWCRERLADYKVPRLVEFRDDLPRNATGKVLKRDLRSG